MSAVAAQRRNLPAAGGVALLVAGFAADAALGDPARMHPVAGFGDLAGAVERRLWRPSRDRRAPLREPPRRCRRCRRWVARERSDRRGYA